MHRQLASWIDLTVRNYSINTGTYTHRSSGRNGKGQCYAWGVEVRANAGWKPVLHRVKEAITPRMEVLCSGSVPKYIRSRTMPHMVSTMPQQFSTKASTPSLLARRKRDSTTSQEAEPSSRRSAACGFNRRCAFKLISMAIIPRKRFIKINTMQDMEK